MIIARQFLKRCNWGEWAGHDEGMTGDALLKFVDQSLFPQLGNLDLSAYAIGTTAAGGNASLVAAQQHHHLYFSLR